MILGGQNKSGTTFLSSEGKHSRSGVLDKGCLLDPNSTWAPLSPLFDQALTLVYKDLNKYQHSFYQLG